MYTVHMCISLCYKINSVTSAVTELFFSLVSYS